MKNKQIKVGALISYIAIIVNVVAGLLYTPWMISKIGQSQYGLFTLANSLVSLFLIDFGLSSATARYISNYRAKNENEKINSFLGIVYKLYGLVDLVLFVVFAVLYIFVGNIYRGLTVNELAQFKMILFIVCVYNLISFPFVTLNGILTSYEKFIQLKFADLLYRVLLVSFSIISLYLGFELYGLVLSMVIVGFLTIFYKIIIIKTKIGIKIDFGKSESGLYRSIFSFSLWVTVAALAQRLIFNIAPTVLGIVSTSAAIAVFGIITAIEGYSFVITTAINGMFMPTISRIYTEKNAEEKMMPLFINVGKFQFGINALIVIGWFLLGKEFIQLWVGSSYNDAYIGIFLVLVPGLFFNSLQVSNTAMIVQNKVKFQAVVALICGIINIIFLFAFSLIWGALGAAISICIVYIIRAIIYNIATQKIMKFDMKRFVKQCYLKMVLPTFLTLVCGLFLLKRICLYGGWFDLIIKIALVIVVYFLLIFIFVIDKETQKMIFTKIKKVKIKNGIK